MIRTLLVTCAVAFPLCSAVAQSADDLAAEAFRFCSETSNGNAYPSLDGCMEYQQQGVEALIEAIRSGQRSIALACISGSQHEGRTDFAAAGLCAAIMKRESAR